MTPTSTMITTVINYVTDPKGCHFDKIEPADEVSTPSENQNNEICRRKQRVSCANQSNQINVDKIAQSEITSFLLATGEKRSKMEESLRKLKDENLLELCLKWSSIMINNEENEYDELPFYRPHDS